MNLGVDVNPCFWYTPAYTPSLCPQSFKIVQKVCGGPFTSYVHFPPLEHSTWFSAWWSLSTWNKAIVRIDANFITWVLYPCRKYVMSWMILFLFIHLLCTFKFYFIVSSKWHFRVYRRRLNSHICFSVQFILMCCYDWSI